MKRLQVGKQFGHWQLPAACFENTQDHPVSAINLVLIQLRNHHFATVDFEAARFSNQTQKFFH
jgi:hypothetical protein